MDPWKFQQVCDQICSGQRQTNGIGTLGEKTIHAVLKQYWDPNPEHQECRIGGYIADIAGLDGIIEIQTRQFDRLRSKLEAFLPICPVRVVYPVARNKWIFWIDPDTGEVTKKRKSNKLGQPWEVCSELVKIRPFLTRKGFSLSVMMIDMEEYRYLNGWSRDRKKGSTRCDRIPLSLDSQIDLDCPEDYSALIPPGLHSPFTTSDLCRMTRMTRKRAGQTALVLHSIGVIQRVGKRGNSYLYQKTSNFGEK